MKSNDKLERNLLKLFPGFTGNKNEVYFIKTIDNDIHKVEEKFKTGMGLVNFKNDAFIELSKNLLGDRLGSFFKKGGDHSLGKICDGIFLTCQGSRIMLCFVELKKTIKNFDAFASALKQLEGSYFKTAMLLSLRYCVKDLDIVVFICGELPPLKRDPDTDYIDKVGQFKESNEEPETKYKMFSQKRKVEINFPFFMARDTVHEQYHKDKIKLYHLKFGDTFDFESLAS